MYYLIGQTDGLSTPHLSRAAKHADRDQDEVSHRQRRGQVRLTIKVIIHQEEIPFDQLSDQPD